ncbi:armadillo-type protein [Pilobolus umbonatus]|nr:armadillo-type protein [Pilobolus umbonatus]
MSATVSALQTGSQAYHIPLDIINSTLLEFFTLVPEEISNADIIGGKKSQLMGELKEGIPLVISTLISFLFTAETSHPIKQKTLNCLQSWIQYGVRLEDAHLLLQKTMEFLGDEDLFEPAVDVLLESMQQSSWSRYNNYRDELLHCLTSDGMKAKFSECILQSDEETGRLLAKLFTAFGETYADYIVTQLADPTMTCLMEMTMQLTGFEGYFPVDQEVTEIPLNFWYVLQETLFDDNILPDNTHKRLWKVRCGQTAIVMYRGLVKTLIKKACFPDELTWNSWNKDMLSIIIDNALYIINNWNAIPLATQNMEATLFALKSISEEISSSENQHITRLFGDEIFGRLPQNCEPRLKNTILLLMGSLSEWLKSHPQFLGFVMNYIVPSLSDPQLAPSASIAFSDICDTCREFLVDELETLMHMNIMQKVVESVADVIQVLPPERAMGPLMTLAGDILQGIAKALNSYKDNPQNAREAVLTQIQYLSACCRGIQSPNDDYQSLQERNNLYDAYASGQLNRLYSTVDGFNEITFAIKESTKQIILIWGNDEQVVKIVSQFLELGMKSTNPLLSLDFDSLILLVQASYTTSHFSCWLDTASFMMTVYGGQSTHHERLRDMLGLLTTKTLEFINKPTGKMGYRDDFGAFINIILAMEQYPDVVDSYFNLLSRVSQ